MTEYILHHKWLCGILQLLLLQFMIDYYTTFEAWFVYAAD